MTVKMILEILNFIMGLIPIAEKLFADTPKSGASKKAMVVGTAKSVIDVMETHSTGGQKETWGMIGSVIDTFVDLGVSVLNAFGILKK